MDNKEIPKCPHCDADMKKWVPPEDSTWAHDGFHWVCFNDECPYYVKGWEWMEESQGIKISYRHRLNPVTGKESPLPAKSDKMHKNRIIE